MNHALVSLYMYWIWELPMNSMMAFWFFFAHWLMHLGSEVEYQHLHLFLSFGCLVHVLVLHCRTRKTIVAIIQEINTDYVCFELGSSQFHGCIFVIFSHYSYGSVTTNLFQYLVIICIDISIFATYNIQYM